MSSIRSIKWPLILLLAQSVAMLFFSLYFASHHQSLLTFISLMLSALGLVLSLHLLRWADEAEKSAQHLKTEVSQALQQERGRIAAELHDTLGLHLLQAMSLLEVRPPSDPHPAHEVLEQSLLDLKLLVDSIDAPDDSLVMQLAKLRHRITPALERRGLRLHWHMSNPETGLGPPSRLPLPHGKFAHQILKVVQASLSNIVEHSRATEIWITLEPFDLSHPQSGDWDWFLCIEDNGCGFDASSVLEAGAQAGHGLRNMFRRMADIGADLRIKLRPGGGTQILMRWRAPAH